MSLNYDNFTRDRLIHSLLRDPRIKRVGRPSKDEYDYSDLLQGELVVTRPRGRPRNTSSTRAKINMDETIIEVLPEEMVSGLPMKTTKRGRVVRTRFRDVESDSDPDSDNGHNIVKEVMEKPKRGRGRPKKVAPAGFLTVVKEEPVKRKRGRPKAGMISVVKKEDVFNTESSASNDDDDDQSDNLSDCQTSFVFVNPPQLKPVSSKKELALKKHKIVKLDPFQSPKKQRHGLIQLITTSTSPLKRGAWTISPQKPANGRSGNMATPKRAQLEMQDRSARKRANNRLDYILQDGLSSEDEDTEADRLLAETIINESRKQQQRQHHLQPDLGQLPTFDPEFVPTPLPSLQQAHEDGYDFEGDVDEKALFLDGSDGYFDQHRFRPKSSANSLLMAPQLDYDEFNSLVLFSGFFHFNQRLRVMNLYQELYTQWCFELKFGFNLLFYGLGSKRKLLLDFVESRVMDLYGDDVPVLVINGYNPLTNFPEILKNITKLLKLTKSLPKRSGEIVEFLTSHYSKKYQRSDKVELILVFHNIDSEPLRDERIHDYLSKLCSIPQFKVIASIDHINAPLLWDSVRLSNFKFVWHNVTNFEDYLTEMSFKDPLTFGQSNKSAGSRGAKYVLSSLTSNSRSLYKILAQIQLELMNEDESSKKEEIGRSLRGSIKHAIEFSRLFQRCSEEFISSNEINFRTMFMEFVEHKMANLTKDQSGTEMAYIPFTMDEISKLLRDELHD